MSDFFVEEFGTDPIECQNRLAACYCTKLVHTKDELCTCDCGGTWKYVGGKAVPVDLPNVFGGLFGGEFEEGCLDE